MANTPNLGDILRDALMAVLTPPFIKKPIVPDEYERMAFLSDPQEAYENCVAHIGAGYYGTARETKSGFVIKKFEMKDGYGMWLSFAMLAYHRGTGNAQLPRVFAMSIPEDEDVSRYGYALMEKLTKDNGDAVFTPKGRDNRENMTYEFRDGLSDLTTKVTYGTPIAGLASTPIERLWAEFMLLAKRRNMLIGCDMHMGNLLFRNYGQPNEVAVVTDPATLSEGGFDQARRFMHDNLSMVSMYKPAMWSEMRSRKIIETTVQ